MLTQISGPSTAISAHYRSFAGVEQYRLIIESGRLCTEREYDYFLPHSVCF